MSAALALVEDERIGSASDAERIIRCPASAVFVRATDNSAIAQRGTDFHLFIYNVLSGIPKSEALAQVGKAAREMCEGLVTRDDGLPKALGGLLEAKAEVPLILNLTDSPTVTIPNITNRAYPPMPWTGVPGTADIVGRTFTNKPSVRDWKTGFGDTTEPFENWQLRVYAMGAALAANADVCEVVVIHVRPSGKVWLETAEFDRYDLDNFADELREALDRVRKARATYAKGHLPVMHTGSHCTYCPSRNRCPERTVPIRAIGNGSLEALARDLQAQVAALEPAEAGVAYDKYLKAKPFFELAESLLKDYAKTRPIPLPDGRTVGPVSYLRSSLSRERVIDVLKALGVPDDKISEKMSECESEAEVTQVRVKGKAKRCA